MSTSLGEYVSVSSQPDAETAEPRQEKRELATMPDEEFAELVALYQAKGLSARTAEQVAAELTASDPLAAHLDAELHIDPENMPSPLPAAGATCQVGTRRMRTMVECVTKPVSFDIVRSC